MQRMEASPSSSDRIGRRRRGVTSVDLGVLHGDFQAAARRAGKSPSALLRSLAIAWLEGDAPREGDFQHAEKGGISASGVAAPPATRRYPIAVELPGRVDGARQAVKLSLTDSEHRLACEIAEADGFTLNRWVAAMVRARLVSGAVLGTTELTALIEANAQLGALGRNLNQIARILNTEGIGPERYPEHDLLVALQDAVQSQMKELKQVLLRNSERWALEDRRA